jgi:hypothetical protein
MIIDVKCENELCKNANEIVEINVPMSQVSEPVICPLCQSVMKRVWNSSVGVRTSDGYKS